MVQRSTIERCELAVRQDGVGGGTGWKVRRGVKDWTDGVMDGIINLDSGLRKMIAYGGLVSGLQICKYRVPALDVTTARSRSSDQLVAIAQIELTKEKDWADEMDAGDVVFAYVASQTFPGIRRRSLRVLDQQALLDWTLGVILDSPLTLQSGAYIYNLDKDVVTKKAKKQAPLVHWAKDSESAKTVIDTNASLLFQELGRLSSVAAGAIERMASLDTLGEVVHKIFNFAYLIHTKWGLSPLSTVEDEALLTDETKQITPKLWQINKAVLFSFTMIFKAVTDKILSVPKFATSEEAFHLAHTIVSSYAYLYFITSKFGHDGFTTYKQVFYAAMDVLAQNPAKCLDLVKEVEPSNKNVSDPMCRARVVYYLNMVEQVVSLMPDEQLEAILRLLSPYLSDSNHVDLFEASHSVVLAIFEKNQRISKTLAPVYVKIILDAYPIHLSLVQFRLAFKTVVQSLSAHDDAIAWYCLQRLIETIPSLPEDKTMPSDPNGPHYIQVLIDQIATVNLVLMETLLEEIKNHIVDYPRGHSERAQLTKALFDRLSSGDEGDYTKRELGVKWWLEERQAFN